MSHGPLFKRRRLSPPENRPTARQEDQDTTKDFYQHAARWNLEYDYEQRAHKGKKNAKESNRLPTKTLEGQVVQATPIAEPAQDRDDDSFLGSGSEGDEGVEQQATEEQERKPHLSQRQQIVIAKEELARVAGLITEDPEEHIGALNILAQHAASSNITIKKLALATQLAVYKDIIPGYRIRPASEDELRSKLSKEVKKLRTFEQALVQGYKEYVHDLTKTTRRSSTDAPEGLASLATVAISCASTLLNAVPHFNFRDQVLNILVDRMSSRIVDADFIRCREALETLFQNDEDGNASLEAVSILTSMMKSKKYHIDESVLNTFLNLRLLSEFAHKGSSKGIDKAEEGSNDGKRLKQKREFRTKRERKLLKERKVVEKELKEADAVVSHEERDKNQSEQLKLVFVAYFRILKARTPSLMGAVLEGLARYAHLINQDFFGDILEALKDLITDAETATDIEDGAHEKSDENTARNFTRESLLCITTAFALLQGQDVAKSASALHLDLNFFTTHLYRTLLPISLNPDIELSAKSLHLPDPHAADSDPAANKKLRVNAQTTTVLLLRSLQAVLLPPTSVRSVPPLRVAAFSKQLVSAALHLPEKSCLATVGLMNTIAKTHGRRITALWHTEERKGDGVFDALRADVEGSNPFAGTVWEGELLRRHYCPKVSQGILALEKAVLESR
ncbi:hypothetical protein LTR50_005031 [Elasticomyces elasticus]|nr:hypothetical protein LTR50_005031 [Elasticomyces elasticus]